MHSPPDSHIILRVTVTESDDSFLDRHLGPRRDEIQTMLQELGLTSLDQLADQTIPAGIRYHAPLRLAEPLSEFQLLKLIRHIADQNQVFRSYLGMGYSDTFTPPVIQRNILENPGWYTQYTPYQAEIAQGRLQALLNFQTMISDLTGMELANASLLDEGTAAAEGMHLCQSANRTKRRNRFFVSRTCHPQTIEVVQTRARPLGIDVVVERREDIRWSDQIFGALIQYPETDGRLVDYRAFCADAQRHGALVVTSADLLALALLTPPGEWGADVVVGNSQRFGVPLGFGGPHAAYFATREQFRRLIPGRLAGISRDTQGRPALRLALQTREQHIRREKATSNICTAQVLLAIMASMYAVYHGPQGIRRIASRVHELTSLLACGLQRLGFQIRHHHYFDTLRVEASETESRLIIERARRYKMNFRVFEDSGIGISLDETTSLEDIEEILQVFAQRKQLGFKVSDLDHDPQSSLLLPRTSEYLTHPVFNSYHSETEMLRYMHRLQAGDLSLAHSMIPLGSCTMKLNATSEMVPISWPEWNRIHPFAPLEQARGYQILILQLEEMLREITGLAGVSLQPNAGSQGEYSGLLCIRGFHHSRGEPHRDVCLIPTSAHGTNPASATLAGMQVVAVQCDAEGNIDISDLKGKIEKLAGRLACLMITYPSTHGVFEESILEICELVHRAGGQVYMDGANLNAQVGLCRPGDFGVDVCHLNLHKTFCIPHGGGGPGVGPIAVASHLVPFLPGHFRVQVGGEKSVGAVASAPWGSAAILSISWSYIKLMGSEGLKKASQVAILNANYIARRLDSHYPVLYRGRNGRVAHECILDCRRFKRSLGIGVIDIAKRLIDYGFHAPTVSWPVVETMMIEPTECESKEELDRFCEAMISIRQEIREIEQGLADPENNVLKNAPHTAWMLAAEPWDHPYTREKAAFPLSRLRLHKFWPQVGRVDDAFGDRNLICQCPPVEEYVEALP